MNTFKETGNNFPAIRVYQGSPEVAWKPMEFRVLPIRWNRYGRQINARGLEVTGSEIQ